jgi:diphthamide biosynthesis methyltransferase
LLVSKLVTRANLSLALLTRLATLLFELSQLFLTSPLDREHSEGDRGLHALHHLQVHVEALALVLLLGIALPVAT